MLQGVGLLERVEELVEDVLLCLLARHHIWVLLGVISGSDVVNVEDTASILVDNLEGLLRQTNPTSVHRSHDFPQEFIIHNLTVVIRVESIEDSLDL